MEKEFLVINSFSGENLTGNPAAVFFDPSGLENHTLQNIAKQINLVETVFVYPSDNADFLFRYFTPHKEVSLAGHPTIAACIALVNAKKIDPYKQSIYQIETQNGLREVVIEIIKNQVLVKMKQSSPKFISPLISKHIIANTLGIHEADIASNLPIQKIDLCLPCPQCEVSLSQHCSPKITPHFLKFYFYFKLTLNSSNQRAQAIVSLCIRP